MGLRYLVNARPLPNLRRTADLVFRGPRIAVFIDGCYWHACPQHFRQPSEHPAYWRTKIDRNRERDAETNAVLAQYGWTVLRFWSHLDASEIADAIAAAVSEPRPRWLA
jgi:DNA mismatch endonuclease (patch repair protein)